MSVPVLSTQIGVDGGQRLGRGHLLDEGVHPRQPDGGDRERDAHQEHEALRDQRHEAGGRGLGRLVESDAADREREQQQDRASGTISDRGRPQHAVDLDLERRGWMAERAGLAGDLLGVALARARRRPRSSRSPTRQNEPESSRSPSRLRTPSDSPVSIDSSMRQAARATTTTPSATSWSPGSTRTRSPGTTSSARSSIGSAVADRRFALRARPAARAGRASPWPSAPGGSRSPS